MQMQPAAGNRLKRLWHEARNQPFPARHCSRHVADCEQVIGGLDGVGMADVDLELAGAILGGNLLQPNIHRLEDVADAMEQFGVRLQTIEREHAARVRRRGFAIVPDARHMAVAPSTNMLFVGTRKTNVWAVTDRNGDGVADEVKAFAPSLNFKVPNGVCWTRDGFLLVVEHNLDVVKSADWVLDLGPEGGERGGTIVAQGSPEAVAAVEASHTGRFLKAVL